MRDYIELLLAQVLWLLDNFTFENGGTMFYPGARDVESRQRIEALSSLLPGSHEFFSPPNIEQFSTPEVAQAR